MATTISTQDIVDAKRDIEDIGKAVNEKVIVSPRYGGDFKSLPMIADEAQLSINGWDEAIRLVTYENGVPALAVSDSSGRTQQEINDLTGAPYWVRVGGYNIGERVVLENGDIVQSVVAGNTVDPNVDMAGWKNEWADQRDKNSLTVDILEFIQKSEWDLIKNGTSAYDCTPSLVQAVATGKKVTIGQSGTYKLNTPYIGTSNFDLEATASDVVLDANDNTAGYAIENSGSVTKLSATYTNPVKHQASITLSDVSGLKSGDWLCFYCPTDNSYSSWRAYYRAGEWKQIRAIVGNIVWFTKPFIADYAGLTLDLYKLNSVTCKLKNVKLSRKNSTSGFVKFSLSSNASDDNVNLDLKVREGIFYDRCVQPKSTYASGINEGNGSTNDYGILFGNCQHARVLNADIYSRRHAIVLGGSDNICAVSVSDFRCYDSVLSADPAALAGAGDMHGNVRDSSYEDCTIYGGTNIGGGEDCYYKRCKIYSDGEGVCGYGREIIGGSMGWIDCEYHSNGDPHPSGRSVISFGGNSTTSITEKTTKDVSIHVSGDVFGGDSYGSVVIFTKFRNRGANVKVNFILDGIEFNNVKPFSYILTADVVSGTANSDKIVIDNISGNMPTDNLATFPETLAGQRYLNFPMRLQKTSGKVTLTTTASTQVISAPINMAIKYPRPPTAQLSIRGVDGAAKSAFGGQQVVAVALYNQTGTSIRPMISTPAAMTADDQVEIMYDVGIKEC